jgi:hypothetical protein
VISRERNEKESAFHQLPEACHFIIAIENNECDRNEEELASSRANLHVFQFRLSSKLMIYEKRQAGLMPDRSIDLASVATLQKSHSKKTSNNHNNNNRTEEKRYGGHVLSNFRQL